MNGSGEDRYSSNWEKLSKRLRLLYPCAVCGETDFFKKEAHHIDGNKKNGSIENAIILCKACHKGVHDKSIEIPENFKGYKNCGFSVKVAHPASSREDWFNSKNPLKLIPKLPSDMAMKFRKDCIKGFIKPGACNLYIGLSHSDYLFGVLGFSNPDYGNYDVILKADTTPSEWEYSTDLLLYVLRTTDVKNILSDKFGRDVKTAYSKCFSQHEQINRYRKHGELIKKDKVNGGYDLGYLFQLGTVPSLKAAKSLWMQKHKIT